MSTCDGSKPNDLPANEHKKNQRPSTEAGRALLAGVVGGLASAVGYLVYIRLPDEHKDRLHQQVRTVVESRISEIRSNLNL